MSDTACKIQLCLEYLEEHVEDDEEVEIFLYEDDEESSIDRGNDHENGYVNPNDNCVDTNYELAQGFLNNNGNEPDHSNLLTDNDDNEPGHNNLLTDGKAQSTSKLTKKEQSKQPASSCGITPVTNQTTNSFDYIDETNDNDDSGYVETEPKIKDLMRPSKPLGKYQCLMCPYNTDKKYLLRQHLRKHFDDRPHKCPVCAKAFKCKDYLREHINNHMDIRPFQCVDCDKAFVSSSKLGRHRKLYHAGMKPKKCTECDYSTVDSVRLKRHMNTHMVERPYQCSQCTYASTDSIKLKRHIRVHTGEKRYECDICHSRFRESNLLRYHRETHFNGGKNVFQCNLCPAKLRTSANLRVHLQKSHNTAKPKKPHKCPQCERSFTLKAYLLRHMEKHDSNSEHNQEELKLNVRRTTRVRSDGSLVSKLKMINDIVEDEEANEYEEENEDIVEI